jgi:hypothetical protein
MLPLPIMPSPVADSLYLSPGRWRIVLLPEAEAELDNIWDYVAKESGSTEIADRLIDSIAERFYLMAWHPPSDADEMRTCALGCVGFPWASTSSSTDSKGRTCGFSTLSGAAGTSKRYCGCNGRKVLHPIERRSAMDLLKRFFV